MFGAGGPGGGPGRGAVQNPFMMFQSGGAPQGFGGGNQNMGQPGLDAFQALFGPGGIGAAGADPRIMQEFLAANFMGGHAGGPAAAPEPEQRSGPPPTSASALRSLPRVKVTPYDIAANEGSECTICLDELVPGQPALRIPCGHLYHEDCVKDWLKKSNECPVCRFELPTDDAEYERGRRTRMAGRKLRMRRSDLTVKTVQELTRLANYICVDVRGCLEKSELVERIEASPQVQIIPCEGAEAVSSGASSADPHAPGRPAVFTRSQLDALSVPEVKSLMERLGVDYSGCLEKADMVSRLVDAGRILLAVEPEESPAPQAAPRLSSSGSRDVIMGGTEQEAAAAPSGLGGASAGAPLAGKSVGELRQLAKRLGVSLDGCLEKGEIVQRIEAAPGFHSQ